MQVWSFVNQRCNSGIQQHRTNEDVFFIGGIQDLPTVLFSFIFSPLGFASVVPRRGGASVRCEHFQPRGFETPKSPTENGLFSVTTR